MVQSDQLVIPDAAKADQGSFEILRLWIANGGPSVSLRAGVWTDPGAWGIVLADLMRHIVNAYEQHEGLDRRATFRRIKEALDAELAEATDAPTGKLL